MRLYGKNPVIERLKSQPHTVKKIYIQQEHPDTNYVRKKAQRRGIPVYVVPKSKIQKLARNANTQGILIEVDGFLYLPYDDLLEYARKKNHSIIFLDGLNDPQNLGAIIRSLACLGHYSLVIPTHKSVEVTETVLRVACGGENYVQIAKVNNLTRAIGKAKEAGFWIAGSVVQGGEDIYDVKLSFPLGLIIGSEQKGVREVLRKHIDLAITVPMMQQRLSLNVAHATTLLCYEVSRQKGK